MSCKGPTCFSNSCCLCDNTEGGKISLRKALGVTTLVAKHVLHKGSITFGVACVVNIEVNHSEWLLSIKEL